jgi:cyclopropane fatty-acyl-phospholipid synthase-like methyltransferase
MHEQSRRDWARFEAHAIPSKADVPQLERFLDELTLPSGARVLDLGCGAGDISRRLLARGFAVVAADINAEAIGQLPAELRGHVRDVAAPDLSLPEAPFDAIVCQLVLSIVGDAEDRAQLLANAHALLRPDAAFFVSCSGLSDDLNAEYAALYARDEASTGEHGSYWSRDAQGRALYRTHHFAPAELQDVLQRAGFEVLAIESVAEASSRRPDQRARFHYANCRRP